MAFHPRRPPPGRGDRSHPRARRRYNLLVRPDGSTRRPSDAEHVHPSTATFRTPASPGWLETRQDTLVICNAGRGGVTNSWPGSTWPFAGTTPNDDEFIPTSPARRRRGVSTHDALCPAWVDSRTGEVESSRWRLLSGCGPERATVAERRDEVEVR